MAQGALDAQLQLGQPDSTCGVVHPDLPSRQGGARARGIPHASGF